MKHPETDILIKELNDLSIEDLHEVQKGNQILEIKLEGDFEQKVQKRTLCKIQELLLRAYDEIMDYRIQEKLIKTCGAHTLEELFAKCDIEITDDTAKLIYNLL